MSDLKLLDELLLAYMMEAKLRPDDLESHSVASRDAICRLEEAWNSGEMEEITLRWATYFKRKRS